MRAVWAGRARRFWAAGGWLRRLCAHIRGVWGHKCRDLAPWPWGGGALHCRSFSHPSFAEKEGSLQPTPETRPGPGLGRAPQAPGPLGEEDRICSPIFESLDTDVRLERI